MMMMMVVVSMRVCSWQNVSHIGTCRAGAGVAVVQCHSDDLKDSSKLTPAPTGLCL